MSVDVMFNKGMISSQHSLLPSSLYSNQYGIALFHHQL
ncbi:hypothetical protein JCM19237_3662 [Photobacterium aphoticum]|uniref:Uncharacterized protein n=1 Tax=Photobacterium aphoticum TaxID=754436 RepID=A0A090QTV9_9GAMM|nr:hypothetical protein JCM19237_3662 [Photobacterium aphoticum]